jgi:hypothetical protein
MSSDKPFDLGHPMVPGEYVTHVNYEFMGQAIVIGAPLEYEREVIFNTGRKLYNRAYFEPGVEVCAENDEEEFVRKRPPIGHDWKITEEMMPPKFSRGCSMPPGGFFDQEMIDEAHILPLFLRPEHEITAYIENRVKTLSQQIIDMPDNPYGRMLLEQLSKQETQEFFLPNIHHPVTGEVVTLESLTPAETALYYEQCNERIFGTSNTVKKYQTHPSESPDLERVKDDKENGTGDKTQGH